MNDSSVFRKKENELSLRDKSFSLKGNDLKKYDKAFNKKDVALKKEKLFDTIKKQTHNKEADNAAVTGFRKKQNKETEFRKRKDININNTNDRTTFPESNMNEASDNKNGVENNTEKDFDNKKIKRTRGRIINNRSKRFLRKNIKREKNYISNEVERESDIYSTEYKGNSNTNVEYSEKSFKGMIHMTAAAIGAVVKVVASALTSLSGVIMIAATLIIGGTVIIVQNVTYDFIVDEDRFFRENISQISSEFTEEITSYANENGCTRVVVAGELADWKNVIAFFWTLRNNYSKHEQYNNLLSGDDYTDLKEIFNEFNEVSYEIEESDEEKVLKVNITNKTIDEMEKYWLFSSEQKMYLENLIATDELWEGILGMNGMASMAYSELGQTADKYYSVLSLSEGDEWSIAFVYYLLNENGYVGDKYIRKTSSIDAFFEYCRSNKWLTVKPSIGDIAFLKIGGDSRVGVISNIDDDYIFIILGNYDRTGIVKEIYVSKSSGILTGSYAHIKMPDAVSMINSNNIYAIGNGELLWPVPGHYYVTSPFGTRWGTIHKGMDISCPEGTPVVASKSGTVSLSYRSQSAGEYIVIDHGDGMCTEYMHNSLRLVSVGEYVEAGQVIAYSGNTGQSTGPHCHFGVRINGERVDPASYLGIPSKIGDVSEYVTGE